MRVYRQTYEIPEELTAVNVMQMVFGNKGDDCATGVCFSRDPSTGERGICGEFLVNAQGEDVVAGIRLPRSLDDMRDLFPWPRSPSSSRRSIGSSGTRDVQDIEFTVEQGRLYLLQTRSAKRTAAAAVRAAVAMVGEGLRPRRRYFAHRPRLQIDHLLHPMIDPGAAFDVVAKGLPRRRGPRPAMPLRCGHREARAGEGEDVILVRWETSPDDIHGLIAAKGILTGTRRHRLPRCARRARMGKPCVAGCSDLTIDLESRVASIAGRRVAEGDVITVDGGTGSMTRPGRARSGTAERGSRDSSRLGRRRPAPGSARERRHAGRRDESA